MVDMKMKACSIHKTVAGLLVLILCGLAYAKESMPDMPAPPPPPLPEVSAIQLHPDKLTITNGRDARRILVLGITASGKPVDLTGVAKFQSGSRVIEVGQD